MVNKKTNKNLIYNNKYIQKIKLRKITGNLFILINNKLYKIYDDNKK